MARITLGRYAPFNTVVHKMDARNKIICLIVLLVAIFFKYPTWMMTFVMGALTTLFIFVVMLISKTSIKDFFVSLRYMWFMVIFLLLINILMPPINTKVPDGFEAQYYIAFSIKNFHVYWASIFQSIKIVIRLINMMGITMVLTATTKPLDLTNGFEWFILPLKLIKFPTHEVAMTISIALRFIPTLLDETERIMKAQASRGIDFEHGGLGNKFKGIISLIVPLFVSSFQRSEELANAMEARGYNPGAKRTKYRELQWGLRDFISLFIVLIFAAFIITTSAMKLDYFNLLNIEIPEVLKSGYYLCESVV